MRTDHRTIKNCHIRRIGVLLPPLLHRLEPGCVGCRRDRACLVGQVIDAASKSSKLSPQFSVRQDQYRPLFVKDLVDGPIASRSWTRSPALAAVSTLDAEGRASASCNAASARRSIAYHLMSVVSPHSRLRESQSRQPDSLRLPHCNLDLHQQRGRYDGVRFQPRGRKMGLARTGHCGWDSHLGR